MKELVSRPRPEPRAGDAEGACGGLTRDRRLRLPTLGLLAAFGVLYARLLRQPILTWGATAARPSPAARRRAARRCSRHHDPRHHDRSARGRRLALACTDGPIASGGCLHLRLDREPPRTRHAQRRPSSPRVPTSSGRRQDRLRQEQHVLRTSRTEHPSRCAPRTATGSGRSCSTSTPARRGFYQPQPLQTPHAGRAHRNAADGARVTPDGAEDAARDQEACGMA